MVEAAHDPAGVRTDCDVLVNDALSANQNLPSARRHAHRGPLRRLRVGRRRPGATACPAPPAARAAAWPARRPSSPRRRPGYVKAQARFDAVDATGPGGRREHRPRDVVGPVPAGRDPDDYDRLRRRVLWSMPVGLYVVGTRAGDRRNLMTISWVTQVATDARSWSASGSSGAVTHELLVDGGVFALSLLPRAERALVRRFAKPVHGRRRRRRHRRGTMNGVPVRAAHHRGAHPRRGRGVARLRGPPRARRSGATAGSWARWSTAASRDRAHRRRRRSATDGGILRMEDTRMNYGG